MASFVPNEDTRLQLITVVFRPYLEENFLLTSEFLSLLYSKGAIDDDFMTKSERVLSGDSPVASLLNHIDRLKSLGSYTAFMECLRKKGNGHVADCIEGVSSVEDAESRERWKRLIQLYHDRLNRINAVEILPQLHFLTDEEQDSVQRTHDQHGRTRAAVRLLTILPKKGNEGFSLLLEGLKNNGHKKLAKELEDLFCSSSKCAGGTNNQSQDVEMMDVDDCCSASSAYTGVVTDSRNVYEEGNPRDNTSGCDLSSVSCGFSGESGDVSLDKKNTAQANEDSSDGQPLVLRCYQEELVADALQGMNSVIVAPTGSGKTIVAARLVKAFLDREDGVGQRVGNPSRVMKHGPNKVVFLVNKVPLVEQQCKVFRRYMSESSIMPLSGDMADCGSVVDLLEQNDVIVMTAQILVNALKGDKEDETRMELSKIGLLVLDECHHCQKGDPYNMIMTQYCDLKLSSPEMARPQVLGLTASMGVGKSSTRSEAETFILKKCANLDAETLSTVLDPDNKRELQNIRDTPEEEMYSERGRKNDAFFSEINSIMGQIEKNIERTPGGDAWMIQSPPPKGRGTLAYEAWLVQTEKYIIPSIPDDIVRRKLLMCKDHLKEYNNCLFINRDARTQDAVDHFTSYLEQLENSTKSLHQYEQQLVNLFQDKLPLFRKLTTSQDQMLANPLLTRLTKILKESLDEGTDSRAILFCKTRVTTKALKAWLHATPSLQFLKAEILVGGGGPEGMNQNRQGELLKMFQEGKHRLILATSVAEEGLDIQQCNVVIRYNYISNEISRTQAQGRIRARGGKFFLVVSEELGFTSREIRNSIRERMMFEATARLQIMQKADPSKFLQQIADIQRQSQLERQAMERALSRLQQNRVQTDVTLLCRKCSRLVCMLDDIRCIENSHHVVLSTSFIKQCKLVPHNKPIKKTDIEKLKKILCGSANCSQEWGIQMKYKECTVFALTPINFIFQTATEKRMFKKWKDNGRYKISEMNVEELYEVTSACNFEEVDGDDDSDGGDIWAPS